MVLHEYGHAIQDNITKGKYLKGTEPRSMGEGFGDYWAASNTSIQSLASGFDNGECIGEWIAQPGCLRKVNGNKHYPENMTSSVHANGEIWSAVLWDIFNRIAKNKADKIILESHFLVPLNPTFADGGAALVTADKTLFRGANKNAICTALAERGIGAKGCGLQIILTWDKVGVDLDLHFRGPDGASFVGPRFDNDCAYYNVNPDWGKTGNNTDNPLLFQDCTTGCTQEEITSYNLTQAGIYKVLVHNYSDHGLGATTAKVQIFNEGAEAFKGSLLLRKTDALWEAYKFTNVP